MEHTPGPWHVNGVDAILSVAGNRSVAKVYHPEADAKLIAAAPALLEALEAIKKNAEAWTTAPKPRAEGETIVEHLRDLARDAIKAAK